MKTALLLSGGIDSLAVLITKRREIDLCVFVDYGQPAAEPEYTAADAVALSQMIHLVTVKARLPCSELSGDGPRVVPHRNLHLLLQASAHTRAERIFIGATAGDQRDYEDCRQPFFDAASVALGVQVVAPALAWNRERCFNIVRHAGLLPYTWSCYEGHSDPCGKCASCLQH